MEIEDQGMVFRRMSITKIFQRFYRGSSKEVMEKRYRNRTFSIERNYQKNAGTITVTSGKKRKKEARL